jgi:hypothetical protein
MGMAVEGKHYGVIAREDVPPVIRAWVEQLLEPEFVEMIRHLPSEQIDVRLGYSRSKVRRRPVVILNGGPAEFSDIS